MKNVKKPFYKKAWFWIVVVILVLMFGGESEPSKQITNIEANGPVVDIVYNTIAIETLFDDLSSNAAKAESLYQDVCIEVTGEITNIDSDGSYISIGSSKDKYWLNSIQCYIKNDEQLKVIFEKATGDTVTIKGQIRDIGEVWGYSLNIHSIN